MRRQRGGGDRRADRGRPARRPPGAAASGRRTARARSAPIRDTSAWSAPARAAVERVVDRRAQRRRRGLEVVDQQLGRRPNGPSPSPARTSPSRAARSAGGRGRPSRSASRKTSAVDSALLDGHDEHAERRRRRAACSSALPGAGRQRRAPGGPGPARRRRGPRRARAARSLGDARGAAARRSAAAASAEPPAIPAATGIRLSIVERGRGRAQPVRARGSARARRARGWGRRRPAQTTSSRRRRLERHVVAQASDCITETSSWRPSARVGPRNRQRLILAGAGAQLTAGAPRGRGTPPGRAARRARRLGWPSATSAARGPVAHRRRHAGRQRQRARQRLAAVGERALDDAAQRRAVGARRRGARGTTSTRVDVGHRVEDRARHRAEHPHVAGQLREHRRDAVGAAAGRGGEALADLLLHHRHPAGDAGRAPRSCAGSRRRRCRRAGWRPPWSARGRAPARSSAIASARCSVALANGASASRSGASSPRSISTTCTWAQRGREVLGEHAEPAADLEHDVVGRQLRSPLDDAEDVRVDQEVLAELAVGPHAELRAAGAGSAGSGARRSPAEQPRGVGLDHRRRAPRRRSRGASATKRGGVDDERRLVALLAHRLGRQVGRVGLDQQPVGRARARRRRRGRSRSGR